MKLRKILSYLKNILSKLITVREFFRQAPYLLEEINTETEQVIIHCRGSRARN